METNNINQEDKYKDIFQTGDIVTCIINGQRITDAKIYKEDTEISICNNQKGGGGKAKFGYAGGLSIRLGNGLGCFYDEDVRQLALLNRKPTEEELKYIKRTYKQ